MSLINDLTSAINIQQERQNRDYMEKMSKPLQERVNKGHTLANVDIEIDFYEGLPNDFCPILGGSNAYIHRVRVSCPNNISRFREGSTVLLSQGNYMFKMTIEEDNLGEMVLISGDFDVKHNYINRLSYPHHGWEINEENSNITQRLLTASRDSLSANPSLNQNLEQMLCGRLNNKYESTNITISNNASQNEALAKALGCSKFHIIQGPPGTGKTYTIAKIVKELIKLGKKVFITAPTHTAINACLNSISKDIPDRTKIIKIGEKNQADEIIANEYISRKTRLSYSSYQYSDFSKSGVVVGATPYALCYPASKKLQGWSFDYIIIDEAAQMSIPLALAALIYGAKYIFVGDHKQLDPIIPTATGNWLFSKSVFKHLVDNYPDNITMLNQSYRLSRELVRIPSALFYSNRLTSVKELENKEFVSFRCSDKSGVILKHQSNEVLYLHHEFDSLGRSPYEAKLSASLVDSLLNNGVSLSDIAVITPYRAQVREVKRALVQNGVIREDNLDSLFIDTIERMQGQEKDYVIFTLANSNPAEVEDRLEFFYSPNRLNVAITRACIKCIVIANEKVFQLCENAIENGSVGIGKKAFWDFYSASTKIYESSGEEEW